MIITGSQIEVENVEIYEEEKNQAGTNDDNTSRGTEANSKRGSNDTITSKMGSTEANSNKMGSRCTEANSNKMGSRLKDKVKDMRT